MMAKKLIFTVANFVLVIICTIIFGVQIILAEDIYFAQNSGGDIIGTSCSNAKPISTLSWGSGAGIIGAGDTVHLCGNITSTITIGASGVDGSPITIKYEPAARQSKAVWGTGGSSAIYASTKSYIVIDGGTNGIIENSGNGTGLANSIDSNFIYFENCSYVEIKNLLLRNMYARTEGSESLAYGRAILFMGGFHNIDVHNNTITDGNKVLYFSYTSTGNDRDVLIHHNVIDNSAVGLTVGSSGTNAIVDNVQIYNNSFHRSLKWSGSATIHTDLTHTFAVHTGSGITNLNIYDNKYFGVCGTNSTALMYVEGYVKYPKIYNNTLLFESNPGACGNGLMSLKNNIGPYIDNNTFISTDTASDTGLMISGSNNVVIRNNKFINLNLSISSFDSTSAIALSDYNIFPSATYFNYGSWSQIGFSSWKSASGLDTHSTIGSSIRLPFYPKSILIH